MTITIIIVVGNSEKHFLNVPTTVFMPFTEKIFTYNNLQILIQSYDTKMMSSQVLTVSGLNPLSV